MVQAHAQSLPRVLAFGLLLLACSAAADGFRELAPADLEGVLAVDDGPLLLDVRTPEEFATGHVPGALLIPIQELPDRLDELAAFRERGVVSYCESGRRATKALEILEDAGFQNLSLLAGSMQRWRQEGRGTTVP